MAGKACPVCGADMKRFENPERWICPKEPHSATRPGIKPGIRRNPKHPGRKPKQ